MARGCRIQLVLHVHNDQITTLTFFKLNTLASKRWAFVMMQFGHKRLNKTKGQQFYKLMGSGKGLGFSPWPDWSVYVLLQVWEDESKARAFFKESKFFQQYTQKAKTHTTIYAVNLTSHGTWDGSNPFIAKNSEDSQNARRLVLTRATIRKTKLRKFWAYVPTSQKPIAHAKGLIYTKGVGEWPLTQMATLSLWENEQAIRAFAYKSTEHQKAIEMTRKLNWYKEELFARFVPYKTVGNFEAFNQ